MAKSDSLLQMVQQIFHKEKKNNKKQDPSGD
jgi:hypothetical protein